MHVDDEYLKDFALSSIDKKPIEIPINEWEERSPMTIGLDDQEGRSLAVLYDDQWPADQQWRIKKGTDKRFTLVRITKVDPETNAEIVDPIGYEFEGLYTRAVLREWFREHFKIKTPEPVKE